MNDEAIFVIQAKINLLDKPTTRVLGHYDCSIRLRWVEPESFEFRNFIIFDSINEAQDFWNEYKNEVTESAIIEDSCAISRILFNEIVKLT